MTPRLRRFRWGRWALLATAPALLVAAAVAWVGPDSGNEAAGDRATPADPSRVYDPIAAGEPLPPGLFQVVPRDFIEPVYDPRFVTAGDAGWPDDADVIGVAISGEARAYPVSLLTNREMVVDEVAGVPLLVTWCPVCGTAMVHRRQLDGVDVLFGVQGALWNNAMTWWDHDTGSIWSQPLGEAIAGPLTGRSLELLPSEFTTWRSWREAHPETLALEAVATSTVFDLGELLVVVDLGGEVRGYSVTRLRRAGAVNDTVAGVDVAVVSDPTDPDRWAVFARTLGDMRVELEVVGGALRDRITGTTFDAARGVGLEGPLRGSVLARLPAFVARPGHGPTSVPVFSAFWPEGTIWYP